MAIESEEYKNHTIKIIHDMEPQNPRTNWHNLGTMACFHNNYVLGDKHSFSTKTLASFIGRKDVLSLPLYLYDHSGITMSTRPFSCPWDSGQVGYIYVTHKQIREYFGVGRVTKAIRKKAMKYLRSEVKVYDSFISGAVYGYVIEDADGETVDSCWGFYGIDTDELVLAAQNLIDSIDEMEIARQNLPKS